MASCHWGVVLVFSSLSIGAIVLAIALWTRPDSSLPRLSEGLRLPIVVHELQMKNDTSNSAHTASGLQGQGLRIDLLFEMLRQNISALFRSHQYSMTISAQTANGLRWNMPLRGVKHYDSDVHLHVATVFGPTVLNLVACRDDCSITSGSCELLYEGTVYLHDPSQFCKAGWSQRGAWKQDMWVGYAEACAGNISFARQVPNKWCEKKKRKRKSGPKQKVPWSFQLRRILFVGDSTLEELSLLVAYAAGYIPGAFTRLHERASQTGDLTNLCPKPAGSQYRQFDAFGKMANISMVWAGSVACDGNAEGVNVISSLKWRTRVLQKVKQMRPEIIFFQVPSSHSCDGDFSACRSNAIQYVDFFSKTLRAEVGMAVRIVVMYTGSALSRTIVNRAHCRATTRYWQSQVRKMLGWQVADEIDLIGPTESYLDRRAPLDPWKIHCPLQDRHLTCITIDPFIPFTSLDSGLCDSLLVSPMARLGLHFILSKLT